jgi:hypothetical protein
MKRNKEKVMARELKRGIGDMLSWLPSIQTAYAALSASGDIKSGALMEKYQQTFAGMASDVVASVKDGFSITDIMLIAKLVPEIMGIAKDIEGVDGETKKQFVVDSVYLVYRSIDSGPDGKQNRIKVPFLGWLSYVGITAAEEKIERTLLKLATEFAVEGVYTLMKKQATA